MTWPPEGLPDIGDLGPVVCAVHRRFVPCRGNNITACSYTSDDDIVAYVRAWQAGPPPGWVEFGTHADTGPDAPCAYGGRLTLSDELHRDGLPLWERHEGCTAVRQR